jgi:hypothetical protein
VECLDRADIDHLREFTSGELQSRRIRVISDACSVIFPSHLAARLAREMSVFDQHGPRKSKEMPLVWQNDLPSTLPSNSS